MKFNAVTFLFVMGMGGGVLFILGRRHGRRAQLLPLPHLVLMVTMACVPVLLIGPRAVPWVLPLASYMLGQWLGVQASALRVRRGRAQRKLMLRELRAGNIQFHFQPILDQFRGVVVACEALARWRKGSGVEGPGPWLDVIEADPTLAELFNEQLCTSACLFANQWPEVRVSLNTMPERMTEPGWAQRTLDRIVEHGSNPQQFTYEVLEGTLLLAEPAVYENLRVLRAGGCHVALDDFGDGQANVMRFMSFASYVDTIKIDQKLIQNPDRRGANCLIRLAQDYSMTVVAEGVETSGQLAWLRSTGVSHIQGWVFSKAVSPGEAGQFIRRFQTEGGAGVTGLIGERPPDRTVSAGTDDHVAVAAERPSGGVADRAVSTDSGWPAVAHASSEPSELPRSLHLDHAFGVIGHGAQPPRGRRRLAARWLPPAIAAMLGASVLVTPHAAAAQARVGLGTAESFAVLAGSGITNTGPTTITGDVGTFPTTTRSGLDSVTLTGTDHGGDAVTQAAKDDLVVAYDDAAGRIPATPVPVELGGTTLLAGVYTSPTLGLTGTLTLDAQGRADAQFVFKAGSTLIAEASSRVLLLNGADPCRIVWQVGSSATFKTGTSFVGDVLAYTSITAQTRATFRGRLLARNGAVTLDTNTITRSNCSPPEGGTTVTTSATTPTTTGTTATTVSTTPTTTTVSTTGTTATTVSSTGIARTSQTTGTTGTMPSLITGSGWPGPGALAPVVSQSVTPSPGTTSNPPSLARTGVYIFGMLATGLMLAVLGASLLVAGWSRSTRMSSR